MKFAHHKYTWAKPFGSVRHNWELVGPNGGINFHVSIVEPISKYGVTAGLEFHQLSGEGAPSHTQCWLTGGRCWHDGTSLYASETLWPQIEPLLKYGDHEAIFKILECEYSNHFDRLVGGPTKGQP